MNGVRSRLAPMTVKAWRDRFAEDGFKDSSSVRPGRGRKPSIAVEKVEEIVRLTLPETPAGETHWSCRTRAAHVDVSPAMVQGSGPRGGLGLSSRRDVQALKRPPFRGDAGRRRRRVFDLPENSIVLCMDEKSQIQALDRTQPSLPIKPGPAGDDDPRLQAPRYHHAVRRAGRPARLGDRPVPAPSSPRRVFEVPTDDRSRGPQTPANRSRPRQLRHPQAPYRRGLAGQAPTFRGALNADLQQLAEHGRDLF